MYTMIFLHSNFVSVIWLLNTELSTIYEYKDFYCYQVNVLEK